MIRWRWAVVFVLILVVAAGTPSPTAPPLSQAIGYTALLYALARAASWARGKWRDRRADPGGEPT